MKIISRAEWGARAPKWRTALSSTYNGWFWHWNGGPVSETKSSAANLRADQAYHMDTKGWSDIAYHFAVDRDGLAYELRGWDIQGGATSGFNNTSMAILFLIGEGQKPTFQQFDAAYKIMAMRPEIKGLRPHRAVVATQCPGDDIANEIADPQFKDINVAPSLSPENAAIIVEDAYTGLLGRPSDPGGKDHWTKALVSGYPKADLWYEFTKVRFAADKAVVAALAGNNYEAGNASAVAAQAYSLFIDQLISLKQT